MIEVNGGKGELCNTLNNEDLEKIKINIEVNEVKNKNSWELMLPKKMDLVRTRVGWEGGWGVRRFISSW